MAFWAAPASARRARAEGNDAIMTVTGRHIHQIRSSLKYVTWSDRKAFVKDLKTVYKAPNRAAAEANLERLEETYKAFFERGAGFPKWAKKGKYNSI